MRDTKVRKKAACFKVAVGQKRADEKGTDLFLIVLEGAENKSVPFSSPFSCKQLSVQNK